MMCEVKAPSLALRPLPTRHCERAANILNARISMKRWQTCTLAAMSEVGFTKLEQSISVH